MEVPEPPVSLPFCSIGHDSLLFLNPERRALKSVYQVCLDCFVGDLNPCTNLLVGYQFREDVVKNPNVFLSKCIAESLE